MSAPIIAAFTEFSQGSLRPEDIAGSLLIDAKRCLGEHAIGELELVAAGEVHDDETAQEIVDEIISELGAFAAPFCRIGSHEGDASAFGCWPCVEAMEEAVQDGEVTKVSDLCEVYDDEDFAEEGFYAVVNDHGNVTLYDHYMGETREIWSVV